MLDYKLDKGILEAVQYADETFTDGEDVYIVLDTNQIYIKVLFALTPAPQDFRDSITGERVAPYGTVTDFGRWHTRQPDTPEAQPGRVLIIREDRVKDYDGLGWEYVWFDHYCVAYLP